MLKLKLSMLQSFGRGEIDLRSFATNFESLYPSIFYFAFELKSMAGSWPRVVAPPLPNVLFHVQDLTPGTIFSFNVDLFEIT